MCRVVGIGPAGLLTTTFQVPSTDAVGSTRVLAAFSALRASRAARPPGPVKVGIVSQPRTAVADDSSALRSEEHPSELQSLMRTSYAVFFLNKKNIRHHTRI